MPWGRCGPTLVGMTDATETTETFQMPIEAAEAYETRFVPAMFAEWAPRLCDAVELRSGQRVLDVACGTGILARTAASRVGVDGEVTGVDLNQAMLTVASRVAPDLAWQQGDAGDLPFGAEEFDVVLCQASLMFFPDPVAALREMARVVDRSGTVGVHVWGTLEASPGYHRLVEIATRHAGPEAVTLLGSYWVYGDLDETARLFREAGLEIIDAASHMGAATFGSIRDFVDTEIDATPLGERIDAATRARIIDDAEDEMADFRTPAGVGLPIQGHVIIAKRA